MAMHFAVSRISPAKTSPEYFHCIEKKFGKEITTGTWKTVERILEVMD